MKLQKRSKAIKKKQIKEIKSKQILSKAPKKCSIPKKPKQWVVDATEAKKYFTFEV